MSPLWTYRFWILDVRRVFAATNVALGAFLDVTREVVSTAVNCRDHTDSNSTRPISVPENSRHSPQHPEFYYISIISKTVHSLAQQ